MWDMAVHNGPPIGIPVVMVTVDRGITFSFFPFAVEYVLLFAISFQAQFRQGKKDQALASFDKALSINPFNPIPHFHKAKVLEAKGLLEVS